MNTGEIAIVGLGCLFPGADSPQAYWSNLLEGKDCTSQLSQAELGVDPGLYYDRTPGTPDKICYTRNGHVRGFRFDADGFRLSAAELRSLDALYQWSLHAAHRALEDSGCALEDRDGLQRCGLVLGNLGMPTHSAKRLLASFYHRILEPYIRELLGQPHFQFAKCWDSKGLSELNVLLGCDNATVASLALGLGGPCYSIDAACASALYAIHCASGHLLTGTADLMLAGAVCHADHIYIDHGFNVLQTFPVDGHSIPLDRSSQGLKAGEGAGVVALKRYADAVRDGNRIYGVIESIGLSNDAGAKHVLVPEINGQLLALERAYRASSRDIDYLECHATGTPVGDQVELATIEAFFGACERLPWMGANKANHGHLLTASGMASLFKVLLAMQHGVIPPTLGIRELVETPRKRLSLGNIVRESTPWPRGKAAKRAGINAFGFGGVNAHLVLREHVDGALRPGGPTTFVARDDLAVVGVAVALPETQSVEELRDTALAGKRHLKTVPRTRWVGIESRPELLGARGIQSAPQGAFIESFGFDCFRYRLPPKTIGSHLLAHTYLLPMAERAYVDAGYAIDGSKRSIAVIVAQDIDYGCYRYQARNEIGWQLRESLARCRIALTDHQRETLEAAVKDSLFPEPFPEGITGGVSNIVASRIAAHLKLDGPVFFLNAHENSCFKAIELARWMLSASLVEAAMVASVSFAGGPEHALWAQPSARASSGHSPGDGGGVVVLKRLQDAKRNGDRVYSVVRGLEISQDRTPSLAYAPNADCVAQAASRCLASSGVDAREVDYLECCISGSATESGAVHEGLARVYGDPRQQAVPTGSASWNYGDLASATGIVGLIRASLCLDAGLFPHDAGLARTRPAHDAGLARTRPDGAEPTQSASWPRNAARPRRAALASLATDRASVHVLLEEPDDELRRLAASRLARSRDEQSPGRALLTTVHLGREKTIREYILAGPQRAVLGGLSDMAQAPGEGPPATPAGEEARAVGEKWPRAGESQRVEESRRAGESQRVEESQRAGESQRVEEAALAGEGASRSLGASELLSLRETLMRRQLVRNARTHLRYLQVERAFCQRIARWLGNQDQAMVGPQPSALHAQPPARARDRAVVFDEQELIELTDGSLAAVLGPDYAEADSYPIRTRMPSPPYLFVSRITALSAKRGALEPCFVEWEYDVPKDAWYVSDGRVPAFVALESSHAMIVAFSVIGCDEMFKGERRYRVVDSRTTIHDEMPKADEIIRGRVDIVSFSRVAGNLLISYEYRCYAGHRLVLQLSATSGFFVHRELERAKGIDTTALLKGARSSRPFVPPLHCPKSAFDSADVEALQAGDFERCFGSAYRVSDAPRLYAPAAKMLDRVAFVDPGGGALGLGVIVGERDVDPSHWVFEAHFKNDPVMPGTFLIEGCEQVLRFYFAYLGLFSQTGLKLRTLTQHTHSAKFRGQVRRQAGTVRYKLTCKSIEVTQGAACDTPTGVSLVFIAEIVWGDNVIGVCDNLGGRFLRLPEAPRPSQLGANSDGWLA